MSPYTLPETNIALEHEWLDDPFLLGQGNFSGANCSTLGGYMYVCLEPVNV